MEDILELYAEPYDWRQPVVCFDERPYQMVEETRFPCQLSPANRKNMILNINARVLASVCFLPPLKGLAQGQGDRTRTKVDCSTVCGIGR